MKAALLIIIATLLVGCHEGNLAEFGGEQTEAEVTLIMGESKWGEGTW